MHTPRSWTPEEVTAWRSANAEALDAPSIGLWRTVADLLATIDERDAALAEALTEVRRLRTGVDR